MGGHDRWFETPLATADDDDRAWTWILSDLHVDEDGGPEVDALLAILERARARGADARVLILGDLFEFYAKPGQLRYGAWRSVGDALRATVAAGVSVTLLRGNRDFLLDQRFRSATGCRVVPGGLVFEIDGRRALAVHGDELCLRDVAYQRTKPWLRSWIFVALSYGLPTWGAVAVGRFVRAQAKRAQARRRLQGQRQPGGGSGPAQGGSGPEVDAAGGMTHPASDDGRRQPAADGAGPVDPLRFEPVREAVDAALAAADAELLVFGHIHAMSWTRLANGDGERAPRPGAGARREVAVLPAFEADGVHLAAGPDQPLRHVDADGRAVRVAARTFPGLHDPAPDTAAGSASGPGPAAAAGPRVRSEEG